MGYCLSMYSVLLKHGWILLRTTQVQPKSATFEATEGAVGLTEFVQVVEWLANQHAYSSPHSLLNDVLYVLDL